MANVRNALRGRVNLLAPAVFAVASGAVLPFASLFEFAFNRRLIDRPAVGFNFVGQRESARLPDCAGAMLRLLSQPSSYFSRFIETEARPALCRRF